MFGRYAYDNDRRVTQGSRGVYAKCGKRFLDLVLSAIALLILSPLLIILAVVGFIKMKGNPLFSQERPGFNEQIFRLYKFRTMTNERDSEGKLLPDEKRLTSYGRFLRSTSMDELPELFNIFKGDMSIVGPRPLLISYLSWYTAEEHHRHDVRPGLTGWAQVNGRNMLAWDDRLKLDLEYVRNLSFLFDVKIIFLTVMKVFNKSGILEDTSKGEVNFAEERRTQAESEVQEVHKVCRSNQSCTYAPLANIRSEKNS